MIISKQNIEFKKSLKEIQQAAEKRAEVADEIAEKIANCFEQGIACSYGICDECPHA